MRESMNTGGPVTLTTSTPTTVSALKLELELVAEFPEPRRQALRQPLVPPARLRALRARRHRLHLARRPLPLELHPRAQPPRLVRPPLRGEPIRQAQPRNRRKSKSNEGPLEQYHQDDRETAGMRTFLRFLFGVRELNLSITSARFLSQRYLQEDISHP